MPLIALDAIDSPLRDARGAGGAGAADPALCASIRVLGVLQPVLLRPNGNRFSLIAGARRIAAAREIGLTEIPAHVENFAPQHELAAQAAENMVRLGMEPLDQWRAIVALQADGCTLAHAAACLGLSDRAARQLDKLGRLHPEVIAHIARRGMPPADLLGPIASAPLEMQVNAVRGATGGEWFRIARICREARIPLSYAIFDNHLAKVQFAEDLFAEPGSGDACFTTDVEGFLAAQRAALEARVAEAKASGERVVFAQVEAGSIGVPLGYVETKSDPETPKKNETVFLFLDGRPGATLGQVIAICAKQAAAKAPGKAAADADDGGEADADAEVAPTPKPRAPAEPEETGAPASKAALEIIKREKLKALATQLAATAYPPDLMLALMLLLHADENFVRRIVPPEGGARLILDEIGAVCADWIRPEIDVLDERAEWIGQAIGADAALPRFDTPEMLGCLTLDELRQLAAAANMKPAKTIAGLRTQLAGALPDWRPAVFGAPGPRPAPATKKGAKK